MTTTTTLNDGRRIPNLAFGTGSALRGRDAATQVLAALNAGFTHIDTAQAYYNEQTVGKALKEFFKNRKSKADVDLEKGFNRPEQREEVWVTTKLGNGTGGALSELHKSLEKLGLGYVDLYLIHTPQVVEGRINEVWREMEDVQAKGFAKSIGVSNFNIEQLVQLLKTARVVPAVNQIHLHPYNYAENATLLEFAQAHGIVIEAYGALAPITQYPNGPVTKALAGPAARLRATPAQVIQLWVRAKGAVIVTTTNRAERLEEYLGIEGLGPLMPEEVVAIDAAGALGPGLQVRSPGEEGGWRRVAWVRRKLEIKHGRVLAMVFGLWAGKRVVQWALGQGRLELPLVGEELQVNPLI